MPKRSLGLSRPLVMGVLNLTPDSFSDGGCYVGMDAAMSRAREMIGEGAAIIDIGGESSRPGAQPVSEAEELDRVVPVIERIAAELDCVISIDTTKPSVMDAACKAGAELVNDISALRAPGALEVVREHAAAACLMHMQGSPETMQRAPKYPDVMADVLAFLQSRIAACEAAGIERERLLVDPGFGFGKTLPHNLQMLAQLEQFAYTGRPILVGLSRKSMFGKLLGLAVDDRQHASLAAAVMAIERGASIIRTHDVAATVQATRLAIAVRNEQVH